MASENPEIPEQSVPGVGRTLHTDVNHQAKMDNDSQKVASENPEIPEQGVPETDRSSHTDVVPQEKMDTDSQTIIGDIDACQISVDGVAPNPSEEEIPKGSGEKAGGTCEKIPETSVEQTGGSNVEIPKASLKKTGDTGDGNLRFRSDVELEKKRERYKCGRNFVTLDDIPTWAALTANSRNHKSDPTGDSSEKVDLATKISLWRGDITTLEIDAIVNAANKTLLGGGGVDGAIHRAAGGRLKEACYKLKGCNTGEAKITPGFNLPAKFVIHTVGPMDGSEDKLNKCYKNSLNHIVENKLRSVAFPCISTGIYGFPNMPAANIALRTVKEFLERNHANVDRVIFCVFMQEDTDCYMKLIPKYFPTTGI